MISGGSAMHWLIKLTLIFICISGAANAQTQTITGIQYPNMGFSEPVLSESGSGRTISETTVDLLPPSAEGTFHLREIWWWERGNRPCSVTVTFSDINDPNRKFQAVANLCNSSSRPKILSIGENFMVRDGLGSSLAVCLNNNRVKGLRAELIEPEGTLEFVSQTGIVRIMSFVPETTIVDGSNWQEIGLSSPFGFGRNHEARSGEARPGEQFLSVVEAKRTNCGNNDWQEFATCNPGNRSFRQVITGLRLFFDGTTLEGVQPFCSKLLLAPPALTRPE